jgi:hypothetical protein
MKLSKKFLKALDENDFTVYDDGDGTFDFGKYSPAGQDFHFCIYGGKNKGDLLLNARDYYENFDPSEEAYYWLDNTGHGKNGAPYDMGDLYNDMVACKEIILEFIQILEGECK